MSLKKAKWAPGWIICFGAKSLPACIIAIRLTGSLCCKMYGKRHAVSTPEAAFDALFHTPTDVSSSFLHSLKDNTRAVSSGTLTLDDVIDDRATLFDRPVVRSANDINSDEDEVDEREAAARESAARRVALEPSSAIRRMRHQNLSMKSNSALLLDLLLQRYHLPELRRVAAAANVLLPIPSAPADSAPITTPAPKKAKTVSSRLIASQPPARTASARADSSDSKPVATSIELGVCAGIKTLGEWNARLIPLVRYLLENGADVEYTDADGHFPLLLAVQYTRSLPLVRLLIERGEADASRCLSSEMATTHFSARTPSASNYPLFATSTSADTLMTIACTNLSYKIESEHIHSISDLIRNSAEPFSPPSLLDIAQRLGLSDVCQYLLTRDVLPRHYDCVADSSIACTTASIFSAAHDTDRASSHSVFESLFRTRDGSSALSVQACTSFDDENDASLLMFARAYGFERMAREKLEAALWSAVDDDDLVLVRTLLHRHALFASPDIDASARNRREVPTGRLRDRSGRSPLYRAVCERKSLALIELLLLFGADPDDVDNQGTPMIVYPVLRSGESAERTVAALLHAGASVFLPVGSLSRIHQARSGIPIDDTDDVDDDTDSTNVLEFCRMAALSAKTKSLIEAAACKSSGTTVTKTTVVVPLIPAVAVPISSTHSPKLFISTSTRPAPRRSSSAGSPTERSASETLLNLDAFSRQPSLTSSSSFSSFDRSSPSDASARYDNSSVLNSTPVASSDTVYSWASIDSKTLSAAPVSEYTDAADVIAKYEMPVFRPTQVAQTYQKRKSVSQ